MVQHVIAGLLGNEDKPDVRLASSERLSRVLMTSGNTLGHGMGLVLDDMRKLGLAPSELAIDLMLIAAHVYVADTRISRESESEDGWTREIRLLVPVSEPQNWGGASDRLVRLLDFLTGDRWQVEFRGRPETFSALVKPPKKDLLTPKFDDIGLFSGGLDSLIGAIDALATDKSPLLISHAGEPLVSKAQELCFDGLKQSYPDVTIERLRLWMSFETGIVNGVTSEESTRGRSFLFFALGVLAGSGTGRPFRLRVSENGLIALNVPLDPLRLGALSTRTTHPFYMEAWNAVLAAVGIPAELYNPYWDKTKGEMVRECAAPTVLKQLAPLSMSCSHPASGRWTKRPQGHCGYCLPCIIRRAALQGQDRTTYSLPDLRAADIDSNAAEGKQIRSFQVAAERVRANPSLAQILIHKPGPLGGDSARLGALAGVYARGMQELSTLLQGVKTAPK
jgi:hypothetical protein